ncbi:MAG: GNAT family N-acetyltransferase, partial [Methylophaga sp.]
QKKIYLFDYRSDSAVMQEIGRLREMTFRQVGEGTGKRRDLDQYDRDYRHLILWDEQELEIAGAYRIGEVARIQQSGRQVYSAELFDYQPAMQPYFAKGIELGRSFVSPKYWGKRSLDYLWYGIGAYLKQYPEVRYLFGPVSLSNSYPAYGQALIVEYYRRYYQDKEKLALARTPHQTDAETLQRINTIFTGDAGADFTLLREQLAHMQVTVPTLYKQYADICEPGGVRFIDFNIDANFGYCIDGLVMIDLQQLKANKRKRYLGA